MSLNQSREPSSRAQPRAFEDACYAYVSEAPGLLAILDGLGADGLSLPTLKRRGMAERSSFADGYVSGRSSQYRLDSGA